MPGEYSMQFGTVEGVVADMDANTAKLLSTLDELESEVKAKLAVWEGSARESYVVAKAKWDSAAENCRALAAQATQTLDEIKRGTNQAETRNMGSWSEAASSMPR